MFKYWKTIYLLFGETFHQDTVYMPNIHTEKLDNLWYECASGYNGYGGDSWTSSLSSEEMKDTVYAIRNNETHMWTFTPKFYKELENE